VIARRTHFLDRLTIRSANEATLWPWWAQHLWPLLLPLPAVLLAAWVMIAWKFNGLYGQDPFAYYDYAVGPLRHSLLVGAPLPAMFWPLGYPILISLTSLVLGPVTAAGQMVNLLADACAVCLTYLLGRDILVQAGADPRLARRAGALGALLLGMTGRLLESGVLIMADSVALVTALLSAWSLVRWSAKSEARFVGKPETGFAGTPETGSAGKPETGFAGKPKTGFAGGEEQNRPHPGWLVLSGTALAWSIVTRWGQAVLIFAWLAGIFPLLRTQWSRLWRALPWAILPAIAVLGAQLLLVFTVRPEADLGKLPFAGDLALINGSGSGWSCLHLFQNSFVNADGVQRYPWTNVLFYATGAFRAEYLTALLVPVTLLGLAVAALSYRRALLLLLSWPALLLLFDAGLDEQNPRFILMALPPIAILAGLGLAALWDHLPPRWYPAGAGLVAAALLVIALNGLSGVATLNRERNGDLQVASWTATHAPARATVLSFGITLTLQHATHLRVLELSVMSVHDLKRLIARRRPFYVLAPLNAMNGQFADRSPGVNYRFLRGSPGTIQLGALHGYGLLRLGSS
jgi:4-amino-4-deoxy-L-arabinose transferase-like glycosyltransferase